jgi:SAM-dependent methyltransferase
LDDTGPARTTRAGPAPLDWGIGHYEHTAADLLPAARRLVEVAGVEAGERVVDVGCGTGSAALVAAARGAAVLGVDPATRLNGNESDTRFHTTSHYLITTVR